VLSRAFVALAVAACLNGVASAPLDALFPVYVEAELRETPFFAGQLRTVLVLLGGLFALVGGALCDRLGRRRTFLISLTGAVAGGCVFLTHDAALLFPLCAYVGLMSGFSSTGGQSYLLAAVPRERLGLASALYFQSGTLGIALGSRFAGRIADDMGFDALGWGMVVMAALVLMVGAVLMPEVGTTSPPDPLPEAGRGSNASESSAIRQSDSPPRAGEGLGERLTDPYLALLRIPRIRLFLLLRFLPTCYWGVHRLLLPLLIFRITGTKAAAADYSAISLLVAAVCQLLAGRWCDRVGPRRPAMVAISIVTVSTVLTAVFANSLIGLYAFGILGAASAWSLSTTMPRFIRDIAPEGGQAALVGVAHLAWSAGMLTGSLGGGELLETRPDAPGLAFAASALLCLAACVVTARLVRLMADAPGAAENSAQSLANSPSKGI
jgi:MFS family permease